MITEDKVQETLAAVDAMEDEKSPPHDGSGEATLLRLAALSPFEYERIREAEAKRLKIRVSALDKEIYQRRRQTEGAKDSALVEEVEPWPAPVNGNELLQQIRSHLEAHTILPTGAADALALWILGTYGYDAFRIWPGLLLTSPEKRCGKTTLLEVIGALCHRALVASNISPAAVFRVIEASTPTLLIDEADTFLSNNEELRGVINSGHTRAGAFVVRTVGDDHEPKKFSTWAPMVIAMIKMPAGTIVDRSVVIRLRRKLPGEAVVKLPLDFSQQTLDLRRQCRRWAQDHPEDLKQAAPVLPDSTNDRALDNWTPLFSIAEVIGGDWPRLVAASFQSLNVLDEDDDGIGPMILADIRRVFDERHADRLHSATLVDALVEMEERPWSEWRHGKPLTGTRLLKPFRIASRQLWIGSTNRHGYEVKDFQDAFDRYLLSDPPIQDARTLEPYSHKGSSDFQNARGSGDLASQQSREPHSHKGSSGLAFRKGVTGANDGSPPSPARYVEKF